MKEERKKFLDNFPENKRGTVGNEFLKIIRIERITAPEEILKKVTEKTRYRENKIYIAKAIKNFKEEALDYINYLLEWEKLSEEEKENYKNLKRKKAIYAYMSKQIPSQKQVKYLNFLGYQGNTPSSKAQASEIIERILLKVGEEKNEF